MTHRFVAFGHELFAFFEIDIKKISISINVFRYTYRRGHGFESRSGLNFFQAFISQLAAKVVYITAMIMYVFILTTKLVTEQIIAIFRCFIVWTFILAKIFQDPFPFNTKTPFSAFVSIRAQWFTATLIVRFESPLKTDLICAKHFFSICMSSDRWGLKIVN